MPTPSASATPARHAVVDQQRRDRRSPSVAPEKAPDSTPTSVMPICTVDRKRPGLAPSASARPAPFTFAVDHRLQAGRAGRNDRQFRHGQQAVDADEDDDDGDFEVKHAEPLASRPPQLKRKIGPTPIERPKGLEPCAVMAPARQR